MVWHAGGTAPASHHEHLESPSQFFWSLYEHADVESELTATRAVARSSERNMNFEKSFEVDGETEISFRQVEPFGLGSGTGIY